MSDDSSFPLSTSLTSPILSVSCSFINFDGIVLTMKESTRHSLRQLKRRVYKKLTDLDVSEVESSSTASTPEDVICVSSSPSIASSQSVKSTSIHIDGATSQVDNLKQFILDNPRCVLKARLFCMGRELKDSCSIKQMKLPCFADAPTPIQFMLKADPAAIPPKN
ncbi:hypothetical protein WA577_003357, partial [Blastocystis sp. JDR]